MAEINQTNSISGKRRSLSTRVDLTPMVDLGFLLITFFIFTTTIANPTAMKLNLPDDAPIDNPSTTSERKTLTLLLANDKDIYYYKGMPRSFFERTTYNATGIRAVINKMISEVERDFGSKKEATVIIKPTDSTQFKNVVDTLDEMLINEVSRYVMVEPDVSELEIIKSQFQ